MMMMKRDGGMLLVASALAVMAVIKRRAFYRAFLSTWELVTSSFEEDEKITRFPKSAAVSSCIVEGLFGAIGNTPLIRIGSLSEDTHCEILAKAEFANPGGSVKDRVASQILHDALISGELRRGGLVTEGSAGSTAISMVMVATAFGCRCHVVIPDDVSVEKVHTLEALGATVEQVRPVSIAHPGHYVNVARQRAKEAQEVCKRVEKAQESVRLAKQERRAVFGRGVNSTSGARPSGEADGVPRVSPCGVEVEPPAGSAFLKDGQWSSTGKSKNGGYGKTNGKNGMDVDLGTDRSNVGFGNNQTGDSSEGSVNDLGRQGGRASLTSGAGGGLGGKAKRETETAYGQLDHDILGTQGGYFANQFENMGNFKAHYEGTAPEIWNQTGGVLDAFVAAAGTGGTVAGISCYLKERNRNIKCYLIDPPGSSLYNRVVRGVLYTKEDAEGQRLRNPFDTITEGIGINRLTRNFEAARLDGAFKGTDRQAVEMSRYVLKKDGLFIGSSSAMNLVGAVKVARLLGPGHRIVTILCDSGTRHMSRFYNPEYLEELGLTPSAEGLEFMDVADEFEGQTNPRYYAFAKGLSTNSAAAARRKVEERASSLKSAKEGNQSLSADLIDGKSGGVKLRWCGDGGVKDEGSPNARSQKNKGGIDGDSEIITGHEVESIMDQSAEDSESGH